MIRYQDHMQNITEASFAEGFFDGWPNPPSNAVFMRILQNAAHIMLAIDDHTGKVVGFITALSDGVLTAYIPLLEVVPAYQKQGIGKELTRRMLDKLKDIYMVDLLCDPDLQEFYEGLGMRKAQGMLIRNYKFQSGKIEK
ncbi:GNAT family N-acetyltransferase [Paenibacillus donghaensis]|uniref:GNAT family N-acetyltransferase n=1 Tax=Paenibacillus donghaensis TaxID=414771 RepID=UPI0018840438|nr:GNAT family N-acetyltransferase [Paenibacillus donghaensis]MBE9915826.1 GNAT family N-acetyltransferase [Paenibacillus donghaensis]